MVAVEIRSSNPTSRIIWSSLPAPCSYARTINFLLSLSRLLGHIVRSLRQTTSTCRASDENVRWLGVERLRSDDKTHPLFCLLDRGRLSALLTMKMSVGSEWIGSGMLPLLETGTFLVILLFPTVSVKHWLICRNELGRPYPSKSDLIRQAEYTLEIFSECPVPNAAFLVMKFFEIIHKWNTFPD